MSFGSWSPWVWAGEGPSTSGSTGPCFIALILWVCGVFFTCPSKSKGSNPARCLTPSFPFLWFIWWDKALLSQWYVLTLLCRQTRPCFSGVPSGSYYAHDLERTHDLSIHINRKNPVEFHLWSWRAPYRAIAPLRHLFSITLQATNGLSDAIYENNLRCRAIVKHYGANCSPIWPVLGMNWGKEDWH